MVYLVPALLACGCLTALVFSYGNGRALIIGQMLTAVWAGAMLLWFYNAMWLLPLLDLAVGAAAVLFWLEELSDWSMAVALLVLNRLALHVINWITLSHFFVGYAHALNALFALQLIVIASTGGADAGRRLLHRLRRFRRVGDVRQASSQGVGYVR